MVNSHYVPQLILRHFGENERIQYCDLDKKIVETRNIKSTFAEKGYYPDYIEAELCYKIEKDFAYLLNSIILKERYHITLSQEELFILKKYLIVTTMRYNFTEAYKKDDNGKNVLKSYSKDFFSNLNRILSCSNPEELYDCIDLNESELINKVINPQENFSELKFISDIKNITHSYVVFVSTNRCKENFIIPDVGFSYKATHLGVGSYENGSFDKCTYVLNFAMRTRNPFLMQMVHMLSPYDYIAVPVSSELAIISFSTFYKFFNNKSEVYGMIPIAGLNISNLLGFGDSNMVEPPKVKNPYSRDKSYEYEIKQLTKQDTRAINATLLNNAEHHFGFYDINKIKGSLEFYNSIGEDGKRYNFEYLTKNIL